MAWTYRPDRRDQFLSSGDGPARVAAGKPAQITANGVIDPESGFLILNKAGSALSATTLAAPAHDGDTLIMTCGTAFAHVVTATSLIQDGVTGGAKSTLTFGAFLGASIELRGFNGTWYVINKNVCTIS